MSNYNDRRANGRARQRETVAQYPRLGDDYRPPKPNSGRKCLLCDHAPAGIQFVQVNWFRGDDEKCACCNVCRTGHEDVAFALLAAKAETQGRRPPQRREGTP